MVIWKNAASGFIDEMILRSKAGKPECFWRRGVYSFHERTQEKHRSASSSFEYPDFFIYRGILKIRCQEH